MTQGENISIYFNQKPYLLKSTKELTISTTLSDGNAILTVGADNLEHYPYSGLIADIRIYPKLITKKDSIEISRFEDTGEVYVTLLDNTNGGNYFENIDLYIPNNDYLNIRSTLSILYYLYNKEYLLEPKLDYTISYFHEKVSCLEASSICSRNQGHLPKFMDNNNLNELSYLIGKYISITQILIKSFWITPDITTNMTCYRGYFSPKDNSINIDRSGLGNDLSPICLLPKDLIYEAKIDTGSTPLIRIPNTNHVLEGVWTYTRAYFNSVDFKMIYMDLKYNIDMFELKLFTGKVSDMIGRNDYVSISDSNTKFTVIVSACGDNMFTCSDGSCTNISNICNYSNDCKDSSDESFCEVGIPPQDSYEKRLAPGSKKRKIRLKLNLKLARISSIEVDEHTVKVMLNMRVKWTDYRLMFKNLPDNFSVAINSDISFLYWQPRITIFEGISVVDKKAFHLNEYPSITYATKVQPGSPKVFQGYEGKNARIYL